MAVQVRDNLFAEERAQRYNAAMDCYPSARYLEILPFLCLFARKELAEWHLVDLASGGGYLGRFFEGVAGKVTYMDQSLDMLQHIGSENVLVGDIRHASQVVGENQADMISCLAAFHHLHVPDLSRINGVYSLPGTRGWTPEQHLNIDLSQQLHDAVLFDWYCALKPGGWLVLIDVPGYPDCAWEPFWNSQTPHTVNTRGYQEQLLQRLARCPLAPDLQIFERFFTNGWPSLWETDQHLQAVRHLLTCQDNPTMSDLVQSYQLPQRLLRQNAPMVPTDFFDDVIDRLGKQRHFGYFPRETKIRNTLQTIGMDNILSGTLPTPWVFDSKESAIWFVHELFGFGSAWPRHAIPETEFEDLAEVVDRYLGLHEDVFGRTLLGWQLSYFIARKLDGE